MAKYNQPIPVVAYNTETNERLEFTSKNKLAIYFMDLYNIEIGNINITRMINQKKLYRGIWQIRYK